MDIYYLPLLIVAGVVTGAILTLAFYLVYFFMRTASWFIKNLFGKTYKYKDDKTQIKLKLVSNW